jgi:HEAT repeat protein
MLVPLFVVPLLIVAIIVAIFYVVGRVVSHEKTVADLIGEVQAGGVNERWQAAAHLSEIAVHEPDKLADPRVRALLRDVFENAGPSDTRLRRYLARLWGAIGDVEAAPIVAQSVLRLNEVLKEPGRRDGEIGDAVTGELIYYLESLGNLGVESTEPVLLSCVGDENAGVRMAAAAALGDFGRKRIAAGQPPSPALTDALVKLYGDGDAWVQMNAALAFAKVDRPDGLATLASMLDRAWLRARGLRFPDDGRYSVVGDDPAARWMTFALLSIEHLVDVGKVDRTAERIESLRGAVTAALKDPDPKVQERAHALLNRLGT